MARALLGYVANTPQHMMELELMRLRARVRELQAEVSELHAEAAARRAVDQAAVEEELKTIVGESSAALA
jgi:uncharacterized protein YlxW (UPF0749 family)